MQRRHLTRPHSNSGMAAPYKSFSPGNKKLINVNNTKQTKPQKKRATDTPQDCARAPEIKLPKGTIPAKVIINKLITLPRNSSNTLTCNKLFTRAIGITLKPPTKIKAKTDKR